MAKIIHSFFLIIGKELKARKARSTEQPGGGLAKGNSSSGLPLLIKCNGDSDSVKSRSRNGRYVINIKN